MSTGMQKGSKRPARKRGENTPSSPVTSSSLNDDERLLLDVVDSLRGAENLRDRLLTTLQTGTPAVADLAYAIKARLKEDYKAIEKIKDRRAGNETRPPKTDYGASSVTDLIGLRIVTLYRLDVLDVLSALISTIKADKSPSATFVHDSISEVIIYSTNPTGDVQDLPSKVESLFDSYKLGEVTRIEEKPSNYSSIHILLKGRGKYRDSYRELPIEIQVRTALEDVWGQIEHSLKYKRKRISEADVNSREGQRLSTTLKHLGALKTMIDGIAQYGDQIKVQIDELEPEVRSTATKEAEEASARLNSLRDVSADLKAEIAEAVASARPGLAGSNLPIQVRERTLRFALVRLDEITAAVKDELNLKPRSKSEIRYIITMQSALVHFQLGNLRPEYYSSLNKSFELYSELETEFPKRLVVTYRLARTLDALGLRSDAIKKMTDLVGRLKAGGLLPPNHWMRSAAPRNLGVLLWEEARSLKDAGDRTGAMTLLRTACSYTTEAYEVEVEVDPLAETAEVERVKAANNLVYFFLEYIELDDEAEPPLKRAQVEQYLQEIGGNAPAAIGTVSAADTARRAHAFLGNFERARDAARTVIRLSSQESVRTASMNEAIREAERTLLLPA